jgi:hypothetical protein
LSRRGISTGFVGVESQIQLSSRHEHLPSDTYHLPTSGPIQREYTQSPESFEDRRHHANSQDWTEEGLEGPETLPPLRPNRRKGVDIELGSQGLTEYNLSKHNISVRNVRNVNPMVSNYFSPIGLFLSFFFIAFSETGILQISHPIRTPLTEDD